MTAFLRRSLLAMFAIVAMTVSFESAQAADASHPASRVALSGYDPVSYFTDGHPEKGSEEFSAAFDDATYWFANKEHQAMFNADPDSYAPQYGGFCAISMSQGKKAEPDPHAWTISDGKLYVFRSPVGVLMFQAQATAIVGEASQHWPELKNGSAASTTN